MSKGDLLADMILDDILVETVHELRRYVGSTPVLICNELTIAQNGENMIATS